MTNTLTMTSVDDKSPPEVVEFNGLQELQKISFVKWCMQSNEHHTHGLRFYRLSLKGNELYAEYNMGTRYTHIGILEHTRDLYLPAFGLGSPRSWER